MRNTFTTSTTTVISSDFDSGNLAFCEQVDLKSEDQEVYKIWISNDGLPYTNCKQRA